MTMALSTAARRLRPRPARWCSSARAYAPGSRRAFGSYGVELADRCHLNIVTSPFPPIDDGPYPPLYEFAAGLWRRGGGTLDPQVAIVDGTTGLRRTYAQYRELAAGLAAALHRDLRLAEDACVALYCPNHVDYLPVALGVAMSGARLTPINPLYTRQELEAVLTRSRSSVLVVHESKLDVALPTLRDCPRVQHVLVVTDDDGDGSGASGALPEGAAALAALRWHLHPLEATVQEVHHQTEAHPFLLPYSSGTTGAPKGVCLTHANIVANLLQLEQTEGLPFGVPGQVLISPLPFYHIYAFTVSLLYCAWKGQTVVTMSGRFDLEAFCRLTETHRPERAHLVPPILIQLAKQPVVDQFDLSSLRTIVSAAAPLSLDTEQAVQRRLGGCQVKQAWGMSELSPIGTMNSDFDSKSGSIGPLVASTAGKVVDEKGKSLGPHQPGELMIHGPQVMLGYLDDPDKTLECLSPSRWLRTGDVAYYDEDGFFFITDRIKELIKVRGYPVAPAELEALLLTHDAVGDVAVIGKPDETSGEVPRAYIVPSEASKDSITVEEIYEWVKERVAPYKRLDGGIVFVPSVPKSASGKILRRLLRDELKAEVEASK